MRFKSAIDEWEAGKALLIPVYTAEEKHIPSYSCYVNAVKAGQNGAESFDKAAYTYLAALFRIDQMLEVFLEQDAYERIINSVQVSSLPARNFVPKTQQETLLSNRNPRLYAIQQEIRKKTKYGF